MRDAADAKDAIKASSIEHSNTQGKPYRNDMLDDDEDSISAENDVDSSVLPPPTDRLEGNSGAASRSCYIVVRFE